MALWFWDCSVLGDGVAWHPLIFQYSSVTIGCFWSSTHLHYCSHWPSSLQMCICNQTGKVLLQIVEIGSVTHYRLISCVSIAVVSKLKVAFPKFTTKWSDNCNFQVLPLNSVSCICRNTCNILFPRTEVSANPICENQENYICVCLLLTMVVMRNIISSPPSKHKAQSLLEGNYSRDPGRQFSVMRKR